MPRKYRVEIDDPTLLAGYIVSPIEAENDVEAEKIAARIVYDRDDRGNAHEPIDARYAIATQLDDAGREPVAALWRLSPAQLVKFERIDIDGESSFECSSAYCGWDPVVGAPHTCPQKAPGR